MSSKLSFTAVLVYNSNIQPSIPLVHAVDLKKTRDNMKLLSDAIKYTWQIYKHLKVVDLFLGMQLESQNIAVLYLNGTVMLQSLITK